MTELLALAHIVRPTQRFGECYGHRESPVLGTLQSRNHRQPLVLLFVGAEVLYMRWTPFSLRTQDFVLGESTLQTLTIPGTISLIRLSPKIIQVNNGNIGFMGD